MAEKSKTKSGKPSWRRKDLGVCSVEDCGKTGFALGLCYAHYRISAEAERRALEAEIQKGSVDIAPYNPHIGKNGHAKGGPGSTQKTNTGRAPLLIKDEVTLKRIRDLAGLQCTLDEAAAVMNCDGVTLKRFIDRHPEAREAYEQGKFNGRVSLRRMQFIQAKRNAAMAIWLGKNYLNQVDCLKLGPMSGNKQADELGIAPPTALLRAVHGEDD